MFVTKLSRSLYFNIGQVTNHKPSTLLCYLTCQKFYQKLKKNVFSKNLKQQAQWHCNIFAYSANAPLGNPRHHPVV